MHANGYLTDTRNVRNTSLFLPYEAEAYSHNYRVARHHNRVPRAANSEDPSQPHSIPEFTLNATFDDVNANYSTGYIIWDIHGKSLVAGCRPIWPPLSAIRRVAGD